MDHRRIIEMLHVCDVEAMEIADRLRRDHKLSYTPDPIQVLEDAEKIILAVVEYLNNDSPL